MLGTKISGGFKAAVSGGTRFLNAVWPNLDMTKVDRIVGGGTIVQCDEGTFRRDFFMAEKKPGTPDTWNLMKAVMQGAEGDLVVSPDGGYQGSLKDILPELQRKTTMAYNASVDAPSRYQAFLSPREVARFMKLPCYKDVARRQKIRLTSGLDAFAL